MTTSAWARIPLLSRSGLLSFSHIHKQNAINELAYIQSPVVVADLTAEYAKDIHIALSSGQATCAPSEWVHVIVEHEGQGGEQDAEDRGGLTEADVIKRSNVVRKGRNTKVRRD